MIQNCRPYYEWIQYHPNNRNIFLDPITLFQGLVPIRHIQFNYERIQNSDSCDANSYLSSFWCPAPIKILVPCTYPSLFANQYETTNIRPSNHYSMNEMDTTTATTTITTGQPAETTNTTSNKQRIQHSIATTMPTTTAIETDH